MKAIITAIALIAIGSPALAQTYPQTYHRQNLDARAYRAPAGVVQFAPAAVYEGGQYVGADPDPQVRLDLMRQGANYTSGGNGGY